MKTNIDELIENMFIKVAELEQNSKDEELSLQDQLKEWVQENKPELQDKIQPKDVSEKSNIQQEKEFFEPQSAEVEIPPGMTVEQIIEQVLNDTSPYKEKMLVLESVRNSRLGELKMKTNDFFQAASKGDFKRINEIKEEQDSLKIDLDKLDEALEKLYNYFATNTSTFVPKKKISQLSKRAKEKHSNKCPECSYVAFPHNGSLVCTNSRCDNYDEKANREFIKSKKPLKKDYEHLDTFTSAKYPISKRANDPNKDLSSALYEKNIGKVKAALLNGADPNHKGAWGPMLVTNVIWAPIETIELLLLNGADVNGKQDYWGITPLHRAVEDVNLDVIMLLLSFGADPNILNKNNVSSIDIAKRMIADGNENGQIILDLLTHKPKQLVEPQPDAQLKPISDEEKDLNFYKPKAPTCPTCGKDAPEYKCPEHGDIPFFADDDDDEPTKDYPKSKRNVFYSKSIQTTPHGNKEWKQIGDILIHPDKFTALIKTDVNGKTFYTIIDPNGKVIDDEATTLP
jgi:ankyrin repeat protein